MGKDTSSRIPAVKGKSLSKAKKKRPRRFPGGETRMGARGERKGRGGRHSRSPKASALGEWSSLRKPQGLRARAFAVATAPPSPRARPFATGRPDASQVRSRWARRWRGPRRRGRGVTPARPRSHADRHPAGSGSLGRLPRQRLSLERRVNPFPAAPRPGADRLREVGTRT